MTIILWPVGKLHLRVAISDLDQGRTGTLITNDKVLTIGREESLVFWIKIKPIELLSPDWDSVK